MRFSLKDGITKIGKEKQHNMKKALFWFRRDLRLEDNCGLYNCLSENDKVASIFLFDKTSLETISVNDKKIEFLWNAVEVLKKNLQSLGTDLITICDSVSGIVDVAKKMKVSAVYCNEEYEPEAINRDVLLKYLLAKEGISFKRYRDLTIMKNTAFKTEDGNVVDRFDDFYAAWKNVVTQRKIPHYDSEKLTGNFTKFKYEKGVSLFKLGFTETVFSEGKIVENLKTPYALYDKFKEKTLNNYKLKKDIPSANSTSFMSAYNRLGIISYRRQIRDAVLTASCPNAKIKANGEAWLEKLARRDFYYQLLFHYPDLIYKPFRLSNMDIPWENDMILFQRWCEGKTGFPLIDAAMIQLNTTGYMPNKMRVLTSSFLVKILLIDYRLGEQYFANKLLDFDLAVNNSGWQWSASCGVESQMTTRVLNPAQQTSSLDPQCKYIQQFLPIFKDIPPSIVQNPLMHEEELLCLGIELGVDYPYPIIDFKMARERAMKIFTIKMF